MQIGCCYGWKSRQDMLAGRDCGFRFVEISLNPLENVPDDDIEDFAAFLRENGLVCSCANCLFPGKLRLTGPDADFRKADDYLDVVLPKAKRIGIRHVVFGSGGARRVPEGFPKEQATEQLVTLCRDHIAPRMERYDMVCGVEELFRPACNILNSCRETMELVRAVDHPRIRLLVDLFHMVKESEPVDTLPGYRGYISHVHISSALHEGEFPREGDGEDYPAFFAALRAAGYPEDGYVSIEGHPGDDGFVPSSLRSVALLGAL